MHIHWLTDKLLFSADVLLALLAAFLMGIIFRSLQQSESIRGQTTLLLTIKKIVVCPLFPLRECVGNRLQGCGCILLPSWNLQVIY